MVATNGDENEDISEDDKDNDNDNNNGDNNGKDNGNVNRNSDDRGNDENNSNEEKDDDNEESKRGNTFEYDPYVSYTFNYPPTLGMARQLLQGVHAISFLLDDMHSDASMKGSLVLLHELGKQETTLKHHVYLPIRHCFSDHD
jgi:hypothetical protein